MTADVLPFDEESLLLIETRRRVYEGARRLAAQQKRLKWLRAAGHETSLAAKLLDTFENAQLVLIARLALQETWKRERAPGLRRGVSPDRLVRAQQPAFWNRQAGRLRSISH